MYSTHETAAGTAELTVEQIILPVRNVCEITFTLTYFLKWFSATGT